MPRNGSGVYSAPASSFNPAVTNAEATPVDWNALLADFSAAITGSIAADGQTTIAADLPMAGFKLTGIANAAARTQYPSVAQVQDFTLLYAADTGAADAYAIAPTIPITAYVVGQQFRFKVGAANLTTTPTLAVSGLATPGVIKWADGSALSVGDMPTGAMVDVDVVSIGPAVFHLQTPTKAASWNTAAATAAVSWTTGDTKLTWKTTADSGWVMMNDGSIGNAASAATTRANADTVALFTLLWTNVTDTYAPVSGGRGASAALDYAANKRLTLPAAMGRAMGIAGAGSGLTARALGFKVGEETHTLITAEMPAHTHTLGVGVLSSSGPTNFSGGGALGNPIAATDSTGGDGAHNNMQPSVFLNAMVKL